MKLGRSFHETMIERLRLDFEFREESLKVAIECLNNGETKVATSMLRDLIYATIGFERLGALMGKSEASLREMLHPDYDASANDIFKIIHHVSKREGLRLEVKTHSDDVAVAQSV